MHLLSGYLKTGERIVSDISYRPSLVHHVTKKIVSAMIICLANSFFFFFFFFNSLASSRLSFILFLNRFSSKLRYFFCMLIFFRVLLEINNEKDYFHKRKKTNLSLFVSILDKILLNNRRNYFKSNFCIEKKFVCFTLQSA